jgi:uncharacterized protein (DUF2141 family)
VLASEGANITIGYHYPGVDDLQVQAWLDQAYLNGLRVIVETPRQSGTAHISSDTTVVTNYINMFKNHPAVFGWYIADESPSDQHIAVKAGYDLVKTLDSKPIFMCFTLDTGMDPSIFDVYSDSYDIMLFDCYITVQGYSEFHYMATSTFQGRVNHASTHAASAGKPWSMVLQGYGRTSNPVWQARLPTANELKFMLYYSICKNSHGWLSWCQYLCEISYDYASDPYPYDGPQWINDIYKPLAQEVNTLGSALNAGTKSGLTDNQTDVLSNLYQDPQTLEYYIVAVNNYNGSKTTTFTINSSAGTFVSAQPLSEGRSAISISNRTFSDQFNRYGVHVYKLNLPNNNLMYDPGDANGDGAVDVGDLGILAANYGTVNNATWANGDFNGDGAVDVGDLGILAAHYGENSTNSPDFSDDYAQAFGKTVGDDTTEKNSSTVCNALGLPLMASLLGVGILLVSVRLKE